MLEIEQILEPFEDATDILQGQKYASICLVIPTYIGLKTNLEKAKETTRYCQNLIEILTNSLEKRLGHVVKDSLYCIATFLDPQFKLKWCSSEAQCLQVKAMLIREHSVLSASSSSSNELEIVCDNTDVTTANTKKTKITRLFSFMEGTETVEKPSGLEEQYQAYLDSHMPHLAENNAFPFALTYWKENAGKYPQLAQLAGKYFTVPATSAPVERVFVRQEKYYLQAGHVCYQKTFRILYFYKLIKNFSNFR